MFVGNGAVTPGPSGKCDTTSFAKGRPKSAQRLRHSTFYSGGGQGAEHHRTVILGETRMSFSQVEVPPFEKCPMDRGFQLGVSRFGLVRSALFFFASSGFSPIFNSVHTRGIVKQVDL